MGIRRDPELSNWLYQKIAECHPHNMKRSGNLVTMSCPFCDEYHTSKKHGHNAARGHYYIDTQSFWCFNCNKWATGLDLYAQLSGEDVTRGEFARRFFFKRFSNDSEKSVSASSESGFDVNLRHPKRLAIPDAMKHRLTEQGYEYLRRRMIFEAPNLDHDAPFYSCVRRVRDTGETYNAITIPWRFDGEDYFYQIRFIDDKPLPFGKYLFPTKSRTGVDKPVYGLDMVDVMFPYIICFEGVFDSIWVRNGVAIGGKTLSPYQRGIIRARYPRHKIVFAFDNDGPGRTAYLTSSERYPFDLFLNWFGKSDGCKDVNELVLKTGDPNVMNDAGELESLICSALSVRMAL